MRLRHFVKLQKSTPTQDAHGEANEAWTTYWTGWANLEDVAADERGRHPIEGVVTTRAAMPFPRTGRIPQPVDRMLYAENRVVRTFEVVGVVRSDPRRRMLGLEMREVQSG